MYNRIKKPTTSCPSWLRANRRGSKPWRLRRIGVHYSGRRGLRQGRRGARGGTAWPNTTRPAITKAFWYQYQDTSSWRPNADCRSSVVAANSPSWWVSEYRRGLYPSAPNDILVNWWFGLFDGNMGPNPAFCPYANYPEWATCYQFDQTVYLPVIA